MAKDLLLWDDPQYIKNKNGNQDLEKFLADPERKTKDKYKKLNINYEDIKQSLYNLNQKNPKYQKELPNGIDKETGFILKHQLDAYYNGYSDQKPSEIMSIENIKKMQNLTTKNEIAKLVEKQDIKGNLENLKQTNQDNIISLSRLGLIELNDEGKKLSPKNTKKTVTENMATAFKSELSKNEKTTENKVDEKKSEEKVEKTSSVAERLKELNERIVNETKNFALRSNSTTNFYSNGGSFKKGQSILSKGTNNKQKKVQNNVSQNKKAETKVAKTETLQETPENSTLTTDNNTFVENNTASNFSNQNAEKTPKEKFNHYNGNTEINGANLKTEFELGKWRAEAYSTDPEKKAKAEEMKQNFQQKIADKYNKMNPEQRKYWKQEYEKSLAIENGKPRTTEVQQRIDALNVGLAKINEISKKEEPKIIKDPNKVIKEPKTSEDYKHNMFIRNKELGNVEQKIKILSDKMAVATNAGDHQNHNEYRKEKQTLDIERKKTYKEMKTQENKYYSQFKAERLGENNNDVEEKWEKLAKKSSNDENKGVEISGIRVM